MPARLAKHCRAVWYPRGRKLSSGGEDRAPVSHSGCVSSDIAHLTWWMTNDSQGEVGWSMCLLDSASKGKSGRMIPLSEEVRDALIEYRNEVNSFAGKYVISTERALQTSPQAIVNMFQRWYRHLGLVGCSSRGGRRIFITNAARKIPTVGGSLRDVQVLAGHTNLRAAVKGMRADSKTSDRKTDALYSGEAVLVSVASARVTERRAMMQRCVQRSRRLFLNRH